MSPRIPAILAIGLLITTAAGAAIQTKEDLDTALGALYGGQALDEGSARKVSNLTIKSDIATFTLRSGTIFPTEPINGIVTSAVFIGEGSVKIEPVRPMDREALDIAGQRYLKTAFGGKVEDTFTTLFLIGLDGTIPRLLAAGQPGAGTGASQARQVLSERIGVYTKEEFPLDLLYAQHIAGLESPFLVAEYRSPKFGWITWVHNSWWQTESLLITWEKVGMFDAARLLINTHAASDLDPAGRLAVDARKDQKARLDVSAYDMQIEIPDTVHILVEAKVTFTPLVESLPLVDFDLVNNIAGTRTTDARKPIYLEKVTMDGAELPFAHVKNRAIIVPPKPLTGGKEYTFTFSLNEETITQLSSVHYQLLNTYAWFPQHGYLGGNAAMRWTVRAKKPLQATGSGKVIREESEGTYNVVEMAFEQGVTFPSLIFGQYNKVTDDYTSKVDGRKIDLAVYSWPKTEFYVSSDRSNVDIDFDAGVGQGDDDTLRRVTVTVPGAKPKDVIEEAKEIIKLLEDLYGPFPYDQMNIAQMSPFLGFGQAPPGFIQLTGEAFMASSRIADFGGTNPDFFHEFFAHEMAHQYWGHVISWAADEDQWLSEAFAEYTAGLYVMGLLGQDRFQGKLKEWRDGARNADPHAPIAWANNLGGQNAGAWRNQLIYSKGPYVVHMLRSQIGHDNYFQAMKNLIEKNRFQQITTDEMAREISAVVGYDINYFFDQWFRSTGIPTIDYSWGVQPTEDGKFLATVQIRQRDKAKFKIVQVPVFFHFGRDKMIVRERPVLQAEDTYQIKLPEKPERISLDDHNTLLADIVLQGTSAY